MNINISMKRLVCVLAMALPASVWAAGPVDVELEAGAWRSALKGEVADNGSDVDVEGDLGLDDQTGMMLRGRFHVAMLGNLYAGYAPLEYSDEATLNSTINFGGSTFIIGTTVDSTVDLSMYDVGWTFTALDLAVTDLELGINAKFVDGSVEISDGTVTETADLSVPVPMLKGVLRVHAPLLSGEVDAMAITYGGNHFYDVLAQVKFSPMPVFYVAGGYRYLNLQLEDGDKKADVKNDGPFLAVGLDL